MNTEFIDVYRQIHSYDHIVYCVYALLYCKPHKRNLSDLEYSPYNSEINNGYN
jgi:hypothetical protein